ncbi:hypothetical protein [Pseudomonas frederiksbergensis]|uniref:Uncharacterized protein n=1 Tax=Pseudomonas frederiksbergensis TaxID=104087 RepID=A0A423HS62_9PSED|nr:hypothetical protein [Pseudomonas frederiksbergensis]RON16059.1 hypothetical protein BK662_11565 [Pseudomonas frederiksbergensis]
MFGFWKRRRLAREQAAEAQRKKLRDQAVQTDRLERIAARQSGVPSSSGHSAPVLVQHDPLHPLNPLSPLSGVSIGYVSPEPVRETCSPVVSDDSWSRPSDSAYTCSVPTYEPSPSSYEPASY